MRREKKGEVESSCASCIELLKSFRNKDMPSPFEKELILDYYDGTLAAAVQCSACLAAYYCKIIDWNDKFDKRVFILSPLPLGNFDELVTVCSRGGQKPKWPIWAPHRLPDEPEHSEADAAKERLLEKAGPPCLIVAADRLLQRILACRIAEPAMYKEIQDSTRDRLPDPARDWFEYLGIAR